jgi:hypothetical protein
MPEDDNELAKLKKEVAELKDQLNPPPRKQSYSAPFDYTAGMSMPKSAMQAMIDAAPNSLMSELRADARKQNPVTGGPNPQPPTQVQRGTGWIDERPIEPPPGISHIDAMVKTQDRIDKAELALRLAKAGLGKGEG